jgi:hypothetical protein
VIVRLAPAFLVLLALAAGAEAKPRTARCAIQAAGEKPYSGPCLFAAERGGSFSVSAPGRARLFPEISIVTVTLVRPGAAEVSGLTRSGINSRWGPARRSRRDPACWNGADFQICVY